jgi:hypothetical protein
MYNIYCYAELQLIRWNVRFSVNLKYKGQTVIKCPLEPKTHTYKQNASCEL